MPDDRLPDTPLLLTKQARESLDEDATPLELVSQLDVSRYAHDDPIPDSHPSAPFEPMVRAILLQALEGYSDPELHRTLTNDRNAAATLGFDPTSVPSRSTFTRARNRRFEAFMDRIDRAVAQIKTVAAEHDNPMGSSLKPNPTDGTSERTRQRLIRGRTKEVIEEIEQVVFPAIELPRPENPIYDEHDLLSLETILGIQQLAANQGGKEYATYADPDGELGGDDPFHLDGPTGETLLTAIKELRPEAISAMVNRSLERIITRVKPYAEFEQPVLVAIDITYVAYYGDRDELVHVQGAPDGKEYDWCHKYATINLVGEGVHPVAGMLPVGNAHYHDPDAYPGEDLSYRVGDIVRNLLDIAGEHVRIKRVYADREFYSADVIAALEERNMKYVIPARRTSTVKQFLTKMEGQVRVKQEHAIYSTVKGGVSNERVQTTLVGLPSDEDRASPQPFITNLPMKDELGVDRRSAKRRIERYSKRGGIETAYKKISEFAAWTTSKAYPVRLFHFGFAVLLYNMWLLVDFLVQVSLDVVEFRSTPRVPAAQFQSHMENRLDKLI